MKYNILVGQSGGPSVAINASLAGLIKSASNNININNIYGAKNGIKGVLCDNIIKLNDFINDTNLNILCQTPSMALGSCRYKLSSDVYPKIKDIFLKYNIKYFFYIGGNDSMDTVLKLDNYFKDNLIDIKCIGIPKTIDNDLTITDHTPGYGSSAKYISNTVNEIIMDSQIYPIKSVTIVEVMGRNSGFLTLAGALPFFLGNNTPHIIAIPEVPFDEDNFINKIVSIQNNHNNIICVISEGIKNIHGEYIGESTKSGKKDIFGHSYLSGVGKYLENLVSSIIGCKVRSIELNVMQRCSSHIASKTDIEEAFKIGEKAIEFALNGKTGITLVYNRISNNPYKIEIGYVDVAEVANQVKTVPSKWFELDNDSVQSEICEYLLPLIKGDISHMQDENGFPIYIKLN